jgi:hypothetical protein
MVPSHDGRHVARPGAHGAIVVLGRPDAMLSITSMGESSPRPRAVTLKKRIGGEVIAGFASRVRSGTMDLHLVRIIRNRGRPDDVVGQRGEQGASGPSDLTGGT